MLSSGERYRLALARLLSIRRPIMLLDETTYHLDAKNEELVAQVIHANSPEQTIVMAAQRIQSIASSNRIMVLANRTINGFLWKILSANPTLLYVLLLINLISM